ncbi:MAG: carbamoyl-phosphate synthase large subunit CarB, partial [Porphyrobacter sp. HL-46]
MPKRTDISSILV